MRPECHVMVRGSTVPGKDSALRQRRACYVQKSTDQWTRGEWFEKQPGADQIGLGELA